MRRLAVLSLLFAAACSRGDAPATAPDIVGDITRLTATAGGLTMLVEEAPADTSGSAKASVQTDGSTRWSGLAGSSGELRTGAPTGVVVGMRVQVYFDGPVAMSYPLQAKAKLVIVTRR